MNQDIDPDRRVSRWQVFEIASAFSLNLLPKIWKNSTCNKCLRWQSSIMNMFVAASPETYSWSAWWSQCTLTIISSLFKALNFLVCKLHFLFPSNLKKAETHFRYILKTVNQKLFNFGLHTWLDDEWYISIWVNFI